MALPKFDAPRFELTIPSTGQKVTYRPYLVKEEKILMMALESKDEGQQLQAMKEVIAACTDGFVEPDSLTLFDLEFFFSNLRAVSVGEGADLLISCKECGTDNEKTVDLTTVFVEGVDKDKLKIRLSDDYMLLMKYPTIAIITKLESQELSETEMMFELLKSCMDSLHSSDEIYDMKEQSDSEINEFIDSLTSKQFEMIKEFFAQVPKAKIYAEFDCEKCGHHNELNIAGIASFFV